MRASLMAACAAMLVLAPPASAAPDGVALRVKIARVVVLPSGEADVMVPVKLTLANKSDEAVTLQTSNRCQIHVWKVVDSEGIVLMNHDICPMIYQPQTDTLAAGERQAEDEGVSLQAAKFREGETYTLHYRFWNVFAEAKFTVRTAP